MIDLPIKAEVHCSDGPAGLSTFVIGNPINRQVMHLVVKSFRPPFHEHLVPVNEVKETTDHGIGLRCTRDEFNKMELFRYEEYVPSEFSDYLNGSYDLLERSYFTTDVPRSTAYLLPGPWGRMTEQLPYSVVKRQNIPAGEVGLQHDARVEATDGYVGQVDELLINSNNMQVTHLVLLVRHIFESREITIPVSQIDRIEEGTIYLKLDQQSVEALPATPTQRWTRSVSKGSTHAPLEGE